MLFKTQYSKNVDTLLIEISEIPIDYAQEEGLIIIHFPKQGEPVLIEILDAKEFILKTFSGILKERELVY